MLDSVVFLSGWQGQQEETTLESLVYKECMYYLRTYGTYSDHLKFLLHNGYWNKALKFFVEQVIKGCFQLISSCPCWILFAQPFRMGEQPCAFAHLNKHPHAHMSIYINMHICMHTYAQIAITSIHIHAHTSTSMHTCMHNTHGDDWAFPS